MMSRGKRAGFKNAAKPGRGAIRTGSSIIAPATANAALIGDSLTAYSYGLLHPMTWIFGRNGAPFRIIKNLGVASQTVGDMLARVHNAHDHATQPGLDGLGELGCAVIAAGTNNARYGAAIDGTAQGQFQDLIAAALEYATYVVLKAIPPVSDPGIDASWNTWLRTQCFEGGGSARVRWCDDTGTVNDGTGQWAAGYEPVDGIHLTNADTYRMGVDGATALASWVAALGVASPVSYDAADVYPAQPQWSGNHIMAGTGGSNSLGSGSVPTGWSISSNRSGLTVNTSIVAADGGDANQTPWLRLTPTVVVTGTGEMILIRTTLSGPTVTALYPTQLESIYEIRFNSFDGSKFGELSYEVRGDSTNEVICGAMRLPMQDDVITGTVVVRNAELRAMGSAASQSSLSLQWNLSTAANFSGSMGSIDIRNLTVRALA